MDIKNPFSTILFNSSFIRLAVIVVSVFLFSSVSAQTTGDDQLRVSVHQSVQNDNGSIQVRFSVSRSTNGVLQSPIVSAVALSHLSFDSSLPAITFDRVNPEQSTPADVVIVIDQTDTMYDQGYLDILSSQLDSFISTLAVYSNVRVGIVTFDVSPQIQPLENAAEVVMPSLAAPGDMSANENVLIEAIEAAANLFDSSSQQRRKYVLLLTDATDTNPSQQGGIPLGAFRTQNIPIFVIPFGEAAVNDLQNLAQGTGGFLYSSISNESTTFQGPRLQLANYLASVTEQITEEYEAIFFTHGRGLTNGELQFTFLVQDSEGFVGQRNISVSYRELSLVTRLYQDGTEVFDGSRITGDPVFAVQVDSATGDVNYLYQVSLVRGEDELTICERGRGTECIWNTTGIAPGLYTIAIDLYANDSTLLDRNTWTLNYYDSTSLSPQPPLPTEVFGPVDVIMNTSGFSTAADVARLYAEVEGEQQLLNEVVISNTDQVSLFFDTRNLQITQDSQLTLIVHFINTRNRVLIASWEDDVLVHYLPEFTLSVQGVETNAMILPETPVTVSLFPEANTIDFIYQYRFEPQSQRDNSEAENTTFEESSTVLSTEIYSPGDYELVIEAVALDAYGNNVFVLADNKVSVSIVDIPLVFGDFTNYAIYDESLLVFPAYPQVSSVRVEMEVSDGDKESVFFGPTQIERGRDQIEVNVDWATLLESYNTGTLQGYVVLSLLDRNGNILYTWREERIILEDTRIPLFPNAIATWGLLIILCIIVAWRGKIRRRISILNKQRRKVIKRWLPRAHDKPTIKSDILFSWRDNKKEQSLILSHNSGILRIGRREELYEPDIAFNDPHVSKEIGLLQYENEKLLFRFSEGNIEYLEVHKLDVDPKETYTFKEYHETFKENRGLNENEVLFKQGEYHILRKDKNKALIWSIYFKL